jgi:cytochrome c oxidase assembly protein subunit 15
VALGLIVLQGVIGGLRVVLLEQTLAIIHACLAQAFFGLIVSLTIFTSKLWSDESTISVQSDGGRLLRLCTFTTALIYFQAISGAIVRHTGERLDAHLVVAALVLIHVMLVVARVMRFHSDQTKLVGPAMCLGGLLLLQLTLGLGSYLSKFTSVAGFTAWGVVTVTTTHLVTGALMLVTALLLSSRCYLLSPDRKSLTTQAQLTEQFSV